MAFTLPPVWIQPAQDSRTGRNTPAQVFSLSDATNQVLDDFDSDDPSKIRNPAVAGRDRPALRWLRSAALNETPVNPFEKGTPAFLEAEAVLTFFKAGYAQNPARFSNLRMKQPGSALALWRWGKRGEVGRAYSPAFRKAWENRLMDASLPEVVRGYALRHALCFALAEGDTKHFGSLKAQWGKNAGDLFLSFQGLFGLLGGPTPQLRFWELPGLKYQDLPLADLKGFDGTAAQKIWICPASDGMPSPSKGTAWVIPTFSGLQNSEEPLLVQSERQVGERLSKQVESAGGKAYFAPSRKDLESVGFTLFPLLIELGEGGKIQSIRMGDAAPKTP